MRGATVRCGERRVSQFETAPLLSALHQGQCSLCVAESRRKESQMSTGWGLAPDLLAYEDADGGLPAAFLTPKEVPRRNVGCLGWCWGA